MTYIPVDPQASAVQDFKSLHRRALLEELLARVTGKPSALLSFGEVSEALRMVGRSDRGLQQIRLDAIVGSVGRYADFTSSFLPRSSHDAERWASVKLALQKKGSLPPIEVYQLGDVYFVLDGNHRVSIAREQGQELIDAEVTEVRTRVPFTPGDQPDALIVKAEYADFLERTALDRLRPEANLLVSAPGQYRVLEDLIDIHWFCTESSEACTLSSETAVARWYDEDYLPAVVAIRGRGLLRDFPGRSETDLYIWLITNQTELRKQLGWDVRPEALVNLAELYQPDRAGLRARSFQTLRHLVQPEGGHASHDQPSRTGITDGLRRESCLFPTMLVAVARGQATWTALDQAATLAARERATLYGLCIVGQGETADTTTVAAMFDQRCQQTNVAGQFGEEIGALNERISQRGLLADLVVLNCGLGAEAGESDSFTREIARVLQQCARPVLVVPGEVTACRRVLLAFDSHEQARAALYVAAYAANAWGADLHVLSVIERGNSAEAAIDSAREYLEEQDIAAEYSFCGGNAAETIVGLAADHGCDLIVMGSYSGGWLRERLQGNVVNRVLEATALPVLVCP